MFQVQKKHPKCFKQKTYHGFINILATRRNVLFVAKNGRKIQSTNSFSWNKSISIFRRRNSTLARHHEWLQSKSSGFCSWWLLCGVREFLLRFREKKNCSARSCGMLGMSKLPGFFLCCSNFRGFTWYLYDVPTSLSFARQFCPLTCGLGFEPP